MKKIFLFITIGAFALSSCKKNKDKNCSFTDANLVGNYKVATVKYKISASSPETDYTDQYLDACEKDDITTFKSDHTYTYTDAGVSCNPNEDSSGTWLISGNTVSVDGSAATIENFSCSGFTASATDVITAGDKISVNYVKQ
ncbi:MAG: lipocalin family protein [Ginsengibacter sp.]